MAPPPPSTTSPWRPLVERVREHVGDEREHGNVVGSINWLRTRMAARGANPNVVRNIIYRDKGTVLDKRALYDILRDLCRTRGLDPVHDPELEIALAPGVAVDHAALDLVRREARDAFRGFVADVTAGKSPSLLITGRPGSGKSLLMDVVHEVLAVDAGDDRPVVRVQFSGADLATSLSQLGAALGAPSDAIGRLLLALDPADAYAVQADAQAAIARQLLAAVPRSGFVLLAHVSQSQAVDDTVGSVPLRLSTPDVPRVRAADWLWLNLLEPLARRPGVASLVSMVDVPARAMQRLGPFEGALRLSPPSLREARRFVSAHRPEWSDEERDGLIERAGRSYEDIRTLMLLETVRHAHGAAGPTATGSDESGAVATASTEASRAVGERPDAEPPASPSIERLARAVVAASDERLRDFLAAVAVLSSPERPDVDGALLDHLRGSTAPLSRTEASFLDRLAPQDGAPRYRCFSRQLARALRDRLRADAPNRYRALHARAATFLRDEAAHDPTGVAAAAWREHALDAEAWQAIVDWLSDHPAPHAWLHRVWTTAVERLTRSADAGATLEALARALVRHHRSTGTAHARNLSDALARLDASARPEVRAWSAVQRAAIDADAGHFESALVRLDRADGGTEFAEVGSGARASHDPDDVAAGLDAEASVEASAIRAESALANGRPAQAKRHLREARRVLGPVHGDTAPDDAGEARAFVGGRTSLARRIELLESETELRTERDADRLVARADRLANALDPDASRGGWAAALRGIVEARRGRFAAAHAEFDRALDSAASADAPPVRRARLHLLRGDVALRHGDLTAAERDLQHAREARERAAELRSGDRSIAGHALPELAAGIALLHGRLRLVAGDVDGAIVALVDGAGAAPEADSGSARGSGGVAWATSAVALAEAYGARAAGAAAAFGIGLDDATDAESDPDLSHASEVLEQARAWLADRTEPDDAEARDARFSALLTAIRLERPTTAHMRLQAAAPLADRPAQQADLDAHAAAYRLRIGETEAARGHLAAAEELVAAHELDDPVLHLRLALLAVEAALRRSDRRGTVEALVRTVRTAAPELWIDGALRLAARRARTLGLDDLGDDLASALGLEPSAAVDPRVRPPDRLVAIRRAERARRTSRSSADAA